MTPVRVIRLVLAALLLVGEPGRALAADVGARDFEPVAFRLSEEVRLDACTPGVKVLPAGAFGQAPGSPAPSLAPVHNSLNLSASVWGLGWHEASDAALTLESDGRVVWTDGTGAQRVFTPEMPGPGGITIPNDPALLQALLSGSTAPISLPSSMFLAGPPTWRSPVNTYETLVYSSGTARKIPTELRLESVNGDKTTFRVFESTALLRPALLADRNGNTLAYARGASGRLIKVTDVHGRFTELTYNPQGLVETLKDQALRTVTYGYDALGRKTSEDGLEGLTSYLYDGTSARIAKITYPNGSFRRFEYDLQGRVTLEESDSGTDKLTYVYESTRTLVTDAFLKTTIHELKNVNGARRPAKIIDPLGKATVLGYDANLNLIRRTDPKTNVTTYAHDAFGNVTNATTLADNAATLTQYNGPFHQPSLVTDPRAVTTSFGYEPTKGDLTSVTTPDGPTTMLYDPFGHVTNSDPPGPVPVTTFGYDPATGALNLVTDPLGRPTRLIRDNLSRVRTNIDPKGKRSDFTYDDAGNLLTVKEYIGAQTLTTTYGYIAGRTGRLLSTVTDAKGQVTTFGYDALGRLTSVTDAVGAVTGKKKTFTYDAKSRLKTSLDPKGSLLTFSYDDLDRLTLKARPDGNVTYGYDDNGNLTGVANPNGSIAMTYDGRDRLQMVVQTVGGVPYTLTYGYDKNGNRTSMATPWGTFSYTYDAMNRLTQMTVPASLGAPARVFGFEYDAAGRRTRLAYPNGTEATYAYDAASQLREIRHKRQLSTATLALAQYDYDLAGNRTTMTDLNGTHFYGYDELYRATAAVHPPASSLPIKHETFTYDPVGNRQADARATGYTYDQANRLLSDSLFTYCNDDNGNRTCKQSRANPLDRTDYVYDSENQLIQVRNSTGTFNYKYDGLGRRIEKSSGTRASQTVRYVYDNEDILAMVDGANNPIAVFGNNPGVGEPLLVRHENGQEFFVHADALGSITAHSDYIGAMVETAEYAIYGTPVFIDVRGPPVASGASFTGSQSVFAGATWEPGTRLHQHGVRWRDSESGGFLSEEPLKLDGPNPYWYARANPVKFVDPSGAAAEQSLQKLEPGSGGSFGGGIGGFSGKGRAPDLIAIGKSKNLDAFATERGAGTLMRSPNWQDEFLRRMKDRNTRLVVNLDDLSCSPGSAVQKAASGRNYSPFDWELLQIKLNPDWWGRIHWFEKGQRVQKNPFE